MLLALLGLVRRESLTRINAYKQFASFFANTAAALFFLFAKSCGRQWS